MSPKQLQELGVASVQELQAVREQRLAARRALTSLLTSPDVSGPDKQRARCAFTHEHLRLPYQCRTCWLLPGNCVCGKLRKASPRTKVVIHLHVDEWGRGSNTGCLCAESLSGCELLLRGHTPHDEQLAALLADPHYTTALLWPGEDALEPAQLQELARKRSGGRIALVAIDATWGCAVKMQRKYPEGVLTVRLPPDMALPELHHMVATAGSAILPQPSPQDSIQQPEDTVSGASNGSTPEAAAAGDGAEAPRRHKGHKHTPAAGERVSLFRGIRKYNGKAADNGRVSTLEAVAAALLALEGDEVMYEGLLFNLKLKVDAMRHQKHMPLVYGMSPTATAADSVDDAVEGEEGLE